MKKMLFSALLLGMMVVTHAQSIAVGANLPMGDVKLKDVSGKELSIKDAMQKNGVLVMFSCNTCPYVVKNQQRTLDIAAYAKQNNIGIILLNSNEGSRDDADSYAAMKEYAKNQQYNFPYVVDEDSKLANAFGATRTPELFLFDANGKLQYKGAIDDNPSDAGSVKRVHAREAITELVNGKSVSLKESRSVGCSIKRS
ncbi:thioredoxin family protein [Sediminibacterium goheungense]|uniref:Peroxiredoxin n=1 Tax=Sediminibacterium goheungense TaxID=1086393 RepID=A0A4V3C494_9BACT|nr:thioredoxin family protein [Sediminibacterium goheungense]TDO23475.1 peroxiredoxin [Sediminibacterium goheungense]TDO25078.1 peroxiredoxin [Sediminibacterium goheungense]